MAIIKNSRITPSDSAASAIQAAYESFFRSWDTPLVQKTYNSGNTELLINNETVIKYVYAYGGGSRVYVNGSDISKASDYSTPFPIKVVCSDTMFYIWQSVSGSGGGNFNYLYEVIDGVGYEGFNNSGASVVGITLTDKATSVSGYTHGTRLNYANEVGYIDYAPDVLFQSGYKNIEDPNFVACSTVVKDQVITFNGKNYYSIGTNILVPMDD